MFFFRRHTDFLFFRLHMHWFSLSFFVLGLVELDLAQDFRIGLELQRSLGFTDLDSNLDLASDLDLDSDQCFHRFRLGHNLRFDFRLGLELRPNVSHI